MCIFHWTAELLFSFWPWLFHSCVSGAGYFGQAELCAALGWGLPREQSSHHWITEDRNAVFFFFFFLETCKHELPAAMNCESACRLCLWKKERELNFGSSFTLVGPPRAVYHPPAGSRGKSRIPWVALCLCKSALFYFSFLQASKYGCNPNRSQLESLKTLTLEWCFLTCFLVSFLLPQSWSLVAGS